MYETLQENITLKLTSIITGISFHWQIYISQVNCVHPGIVKTDLGRHLVHSYVKKLIDPFTYYFFKTAKSGAQTTIRLAVDPQLDKVTGQYFADCKPQRVAPSARRNNNDAEWLWKESEKMTKLSTHTHPA